ncbi:unnamed protein product [Strongylus vulgaris]|uniref:Peptidase S1 domain-containing protein n=1 Tax=Strongylus vulgaris TaxID=40348 RepID=A0A3P7IZY0_STRVU|nr:unnamed protein product [Strongylus vulgaris]
MDEHAVSKITVHSDWDPCNFSHDLAILEVKNDLPPSRSSPVCMPERNLKLAKLLLSAGSGMDPNITNDPYARGLQVVKLPLKSEDDDYTITTGAGTAAVCGGDSGGPLFQYNDKLQLTAVGVVSGGVAECTEEDFDGENFFADVRKHLNWICLHTGICPLENTQADGKQGLRSRYRNTNRNPGTNWVWDGIGNQRMWSIKGMNKRMHAMHGVNNKQIWLGSVKANANETVMRRSNKLLWSTDRNINMNRRNAMYAMERQRTWPNSRNGAATLMYTMRNQQMSRDNSNINVNEANVMGMGTRQQWPYNTNTHDPGIDAVYHEYTTIPGLRKQQKWSSKNSDIKSGTNVMYELNQQMWPTKGGISTNRGTNMERLAW